MKPAVRISRYYRPSLAETKLMEAVLRHDVLSAEQTAKLLWTPSQRGKVSDRSKRLRDHGYLDPHALTYRRFVDLPKGGSSIILNSLTEKGITHLRCNGFPVPKRYNVTERRNRSLAHLEHTYRANEVICLAAQLTKQIPSVELVDYKTEYELKQAPTVVTVPEGSVTTVGLDSWLHLWIPVLPERLCLGVELDNAGTEEEQQIKEKLRNLVLFSVEPYHQDFGTDLLQILFVAAAGEKRRDELLTWCESVLETYGWQDENELFLFAAGRPELMTSEEFFFSPIWFYPFADRPQSLLSPSLLEARTQQEHSAPAYLSATLWQVSDG